MFRVDETPDEYDHFQDEYEDALAAAKPEWRHDRMFLAEPTVEDW